ncbi:hypothetical protein [Cytobacillus sp. IB215665]|uniref:hypothetical protein n=1 Tax=Cytobacillus sp. IB215665 TaxID=3097357 RepID=UPI002A15080B|nr:hypothetical protein [Cytobacillus sp. IB215665]MDX8366879.1 hypothetical protein [Cytobacillus sp. IB215665]
MINMLVVSMFVMSILGGGFLLNEGAFAKMTDEVLIAESKGTKKTEEQPSKDMENLEEKMKMQMAKFKAPNGEGLYDLFNNKFEDLAWTFESDDYNVMLFQGKHNDKHYKIYFFYKEETIDMYVDGEKKTREEFDEWLKKFINT